MKKISPKLESMRRNIKQAFAKYTVFTSEGTILTEHGKEMAKKCLAEYGIHI